MKFSDVRTVNHLLKEYGMTPGKPTPVSDQETGAATKARSVTAPSASPTTKSVPQSPTLGKGGKPAKQEPEMVQARAGELEVDTVIKDTNGREMGVVVSRVGDKPKPDTVVVKNRQGKYQTMDPDDRVIVDTPVKESVFAKFIKLPLAEQLKLVDQISIDKLNEAWSKKYKASINCANPKGFSQRAHCAGKKKKTNEAALPDNNKLRMIKKLLNQPLLGSDVKAQMEAFFAIPSPQMIKDFRKTIAQGQADKTDLRPILRSYVDAMHPSLQDKLKLGESTLMEYGSLDAAKQEIINAIQGIDPSPNDEKIAQQNAELLDKIYTILNSGNVLDRINAVLPDTLKGEYSDRDVVKIAQALASAPVSFKEKNQFADNLKNDKVIDASIFISPGIYTVDQLTYGDPVNKKMLDHMKAYGVGQQMKGPLEHALAIFSKDISIAGKGDITVAGEPVEVKAAIGEKKGSGGGRFGETGRLPSREHMLDIITSYEQLKPLVDQYLLNQKSMNISVFVDIVNQANLDPQTRADLAKKVFGTVFGAEAAPVVNAFVKPNADPDDVRKAYIVSNFNWYKNSDQGGEWKYLAGISLVDNAVGVIGTGEDLLRISAYKKNPSIITTDKPQEMLYQFNPKVS
jgi:hypothetical protein